MSANVFFIEASPGVKGNSKEIVFFGKRPGLKAKDEDKAKEEEVAWLAKRFRPEKPWAGAVRLDVTFVLPIPASWSKRKRALAAAGSLLPTSGKDRGNMLKLIEDALAGDFYKNDAQIVSGNVSKIYGTRPGYTVTLTEIHEVRA